MAVRRVVSLVPSGTDLVAELGRAEELVGVSHQCDHPASRGLPVLTSSAIPAAGASRASGPKPAEVDQAVTRAVQEGQPLYRTDMALLGRLAPDVVVAQDVCDVCAASEGQVHDGLPAGTELVTLEATTLSGLVEDLERLGKALGAEERAADVVARLGAELASVAGWVAGQPRKRALVLEWGDPPFLGGHWVPELVAVAGGVHLLSEAGQASRRATWEEIAEAGPEVVVFAPCGYTLAAAEEEARTLKQHLAPGTELWAAHATALFSRCTPAAVAGAARLLAGALHPGVAPALRPDVAVRVL